MTQDAQNTQGISVPPMPMKTAEGFLCDARSTLTKRGVERDAAQGERSMERAVGIFNAWTGHSLSISEGWRFMVALKQAREIQGAFHEDDYVDGVNYFALLGEEEAKQAESDRAKIKHLLSGTAGETGESKPPADTSVLDDSQAPL